MNLLDSDFVRQQFPAFLERNLKDQAFFENAGGSFTCRQVIDRLHRFYTQRKVQPYAAYDASQLAGEEMDEARNRLAAAMGVAQDELSFGPSTTQNIYVLSQAFAAWMSPGEAVVVSNQDHEANSGAWRRLAEAGIEIREWQIDSDTGMLDPKRLADLLDERVRLVCFPHCSNVIAQVNPVSEISALVHAIGAFVCVDGVSYSPHGLPNVGEMGPDIYLFSSYKTYGPHQGIMVVRRCLAEILPNQAHYFNADSLTKRFIPAGPDHAQIAACAGIMDYFDVLADHHGLTGDAAARSGAVHDLMRDHETVLLQPLLDFAAAKKSVRLLGSCVAADRAPTVALDLGKPPQPAAQALADRNIMADGGDFYAVRPLQACGIDPKQGVLRLSFVHYTLKAEVDKLIAALDDIL